MGTVCGGVGCVVKEDLCGLGQADKANYMDGERQVGGSHAEKDVSK